jgi:choline dehydrogenase
VILAGGAFNTPQLLMLSGVGPAAQLADKKIPVVVDLPGVGENLQDRYEVGVISLMKDNFELLKGCGSRHRSRVDPNADPCLREWQQGGGVYTTNGVVLSIIKRSSQAETAAPDLYIFGIPGYFKGYHLRYSEEVLARSNVFTWAILKGHTRNREGYVRLRPATARHSVHQFPLLRRQGEAGRPEKDLAALVEGVGFVRRLMEHRPRDEDRVAAGHRCERCGGG